MSLNDTQQNELSTTDDPSIVDFDEYKIYTMVDNDGFIIDTPSGMYAFKGTKLFIKTNTTHYCIRPTSDPDGVGDYQVYILLDSCDLVSSNEHFGLRLSTSPGSKVRIPVLRVPKGTAPWFSIEDDWGKASGESWRQVILHRNLYAQAFFEGNQQA